MEAGTPRSWPPCVEVFDDQMIAMLRAMPGQSRLAAANTMSIQQREMAQQAIKTANPDWGEEKVRAEYSRRTGTWVHETCWRKRREDVKRGTSGTS